LAARITQRSARVSTGESSITTPRYNCGQRMAACKCNTPPQGMAHAPHRLGLLLQMVDQFVHQVLPVVVHRKPWIVAVLRQVRDSIFRGQAGKQLAVGSRREAIGVGKKHVLRHTGSIYKNRH
jgi:hypothetical protein